MYYIRIKQVWFSKWHCQIAFVRPAHPERLLHAPRPTERALGSTQPLTVCLRSDQAVARIDLGLGRAPGTDQRTLLAQLRCIGSLAYIIVAAAIEQFERQDWSPEELRSHAENFRVEIFNDRFLSFLSRIGAPVHAVNPASQLNGMVDVFAGAKAS